MLFKKKYINKSFLSFPAHEFSLFTIIMRQPIEPPMGLAVSQSLLPSPLFPAAAGAPSLPPPPLPLPSISARFHQPCPAVILSHPDQSWPHLPHPPLPPPICHPGSSNRRELYFTRQPKLEVSFSSIGEGAWSKVPSQSPLSMNAHPGWGTQPVGHRSPWDKTPHCGTNRFWEKHPKPLAGASFP